ncbi:MAG: HEAT repeat domain-containing protein [Candidatus Hydrogenedentes bacterium]|nr:HEAT repeat domain-containing protein [Candidatus Hydrogenedentota bacterium]
MRGFLLVVAPFVGPLCFCALAADVAPTTDASLEHALRLMTSDEVVWIGRSGPAPSAQPAGAQAAMPVLVETVQAEDEQTRLRALEAMARLGAQANAEVFFNALGDPSPAVREAAARVVAGFSPDDVFERVMQALAGPAGQADTTLALALPLLRSVLEPRMLDLLESSQETVDRRAAAAYSLGLMGSGGAVPTLAELAWGTDEWLASVSVQALLNIHDPVVIPKLAELTAHPSEQTRWAALEGLAALGGPEAIEAIGNVAVMRPADDKELSRRAVQLLGATKDPGVIPILIRAMDRNLAARRMAVDALSQLTGKDLGDMPSLWIEWWEKRNDPSQAPEPMPGQKQLFDVEYME